MSIERRIEIKELSGIYTRCFTVELCDCFLHIYFENNPQMIVEPFSSESSLLQESKTQNVGRGVEIRFDRNHAFSDTSKDHIHVYKRGKELFAINRDGSSHDGFHSITIPSSVYGFIRDNYPDFILPTNRVIESLVNIDPSLNEEILYLIERQ